MAAKKYTQMKIPVYEDAKIAPAIARPKRKAATRTTNSRPASKYVRRESNVFGRGTRIRRDAYGTLKRVLIEKRDIDKSRKQHYWVRVKPKK